MMQFTAASGWSFLNLLVNHDASVEAELELARTRGWTIVSMKDDLSVDVRRLR